MLNFIVQYPATVAGCHWESQGVVSYSGFKSIAILEDASEWVWVNITWMIFLGLASMLISKAKPAVYKHLVFLQLDAKGIIIKKKKKCNFLPVI